MILLPTLWLLCRAYILMLFDYGDLFAELSTEVTKSNHNVLMLILVCIPENLFPVVEVSCVHKTYYSRQMFVNLGQQVCIIITRRELRMPSYSSSCLSSCVFPSKHTIASMHIYISLTIHVHWYLSLYSQCLRSCLYV